jgi:hypothetical protein
LVHFCALLINTCPVFARKPEERGRLEDLKVYEMMMMMMMMIIKSTLKYSACGNINWIALAKYRVD